MIGRLQSSNYLRYKTWVGLQNRCNYLAADELNHARAVGACIHKSRPATEAFGQFSDSEFKQLWKSMMGAEKVDNSRICLNSGVRHGLRALLKTFKDRKWAIPADVYPVYQMLAKESISDFIEYKHMFSDTPFDIAPIVASTAEVLLVTDPTPLGKLLSGNDIGKILRWVDSKDIKHKNRRVVIDAVYSVQLRHEMKRLLETERVYFLHSISKTHALPMHFGVVVTPLRAGRKESESGVSAGGSESEVTTAAETSAAVVHHEHAMIQDDQKTLRGTADMRSKLDQAGFYLSTYPTMGAELQQLYTMCWEKLQSVAPALFESGIQVQQQKNNHDHVPSYLKGVRIGFEDLQQLGVLGVPSYVYDSPVSASTTVNGDGNLSMLSALSWLPAVLSHNQQRQARLPSSTIATTDSESSGVSGNYDPDLHFTRTMYHVTRLSNFCKGFDKYTSRYSKANIPQSTFTDKFHLLYLDELSIGVNKVSNSCAKGATATSDFPIVIETRVKERTYPSASGVARYIKRDSVVVHRVGIVNSPIPTSTAVSDADTSRVSMDQIQWHTVEDLYAKSMKLNTDMIEPYPALRPRSVSVLPVAQGCQAKCPFCFSHSSISDDVNGRKLTMDRINAVLDESKRRGAERAVITGGGEPLVTPLKRILDIVRSCANRFPNAVTMITNGYAIGKIDDINERVAYLRVLRDHGLSVLSISRHGPDNEGNTKIMHLNTQSERIAEASLLLEQESMPSSSSTSSSLLTTPAKQLKLRWVCVLQKNGVDSDAKLEQYLDWVVSTGVTEICFKELYVSSSEESLYHDYASNKWSREHQIPLSMLTNYLELHGGSIISRLPWGSPIYIFAWKGTKIKIAAYTEPTVYWERTNGLCRSWNLLADGDCFASLETKDSQVCTTA